MRIVNYYAPGDLIDTPQNAAGLMDYLDKLNREGTAYFVHAVRATDDAQREFSGPVKKVDRLNPYLEIEVSSEGGTYESIPINEVGVCRIEELD